jgi:hypothetical protein
MPLHAQHRSRKKVLLGLDEILCIPTYQSFSKLEIGVRMWLPPRGRNCDTRLGHQKKDAVTQQSTYQEMPNNLC